MAQKCSKNILFYGDMNINGHPVHTNMLPMRICTHHSIELRV